MLWITGPEQGGICSLGELTGQWKKDIHVGKDDSQKDVDCDLPSLSDMEGSFILNPICIHWNCFVILILASLDNVSLLRCKVLANFNSNHCIDTVLLQAALAICAWTVGHKEAGVHLRLAAQLGRTLDKTDGSASLGQCNRTCRSDA